MTDIVKQVDNYIKDVSSGKKVTGKLERYAVQRHLNDLEKGKERGLVFKKNAAIHAIRFFNFLKHYKGEFAGKPFILSPWQMFIMWYLFGWYRSDGSRRFNYAYIEMAKKNGKTAFAAGIGLYMLIADGEASAEVYSAATSAKQARLSFEAAQQMVRLSPALSKRVTVYQHNIHIEVTAAKFEPRSAKYESNEGVNPHFTIVDEYHAHKKSTTYDQFKSAMASRKNPMMLTITTAGFDMSAPCFELRKTAINVVKGIHQLDNFATFIYTMDKDDDWKDPANWVKPNPNLDVSVNLKYIKNEFQQAITRGGQERVNFLTKNLNKWVDAADNWIPDEVWMKGADKVDLDKLEGKKCVIGVDLSEKYDITSVCALFPPESRENNWKAAWWHWIPRQKVIDMEDRVDYRRWHELGYVEIIDGNTVDDKVIVEKIMELTEIYQVEVLGFDPWGSKTFVTLLQDEGFDPEKLDKVTQYMSVLSEPTKKIYTLALDGKLKHGGNPVIRWMVSNAVPKRDSNNNIRLDKDKSHQKIDGLSALVCGMTSWMSPERQSAYDINEIYKNTGL